ncbi:MAG: hypothetical protein ACFCUO_10940 [Rhodospirillales bacterium]
MIKRSFAAAFLASVIASPAFAFHCPADMAKIDAALAQKPALTAEQLVEVQKLRAEGEALHKAGDHTRSVKVLGEAMAILGIN